MTLLSAASPEDRVDIAREILERALCRHVNALIAERSSRKGQRCGYIAASDADIAHRTVELLFGGSKKNSLKRKSKNNTPGD